MKNNQKKAVALKYYEEKDSAPTISAMGKGLIAEEVLEKAKKNNIPILQDASLVELLAELNINEAIPEELYQAVAEVYAFIYRIDQQLSEKV